MLPARPSPIERRHCLRLSLALGLLQAAPAAWPQARATGEVLIGGTGTGVAPMQKVLSGRSGLRFVPNLGTGGGLKALAAGAIDIALAARPPDDGERARGLVAREWMRTPFVFACHRAVPPLRPTLAELASLYAGRVHQWPNGTPVRLVLRPASDADTRQLRSLSPAMAEALTAAQTRPGAHVAVTDGDAAEAIERIPGALGALALGLLRSDGRQLLVLDLDGIKPGIDTLAAGRYPHAKTIYLVTRGTPAGAVAATLADAAAARAAALLASLGCLVTAGA